MAGMISNGQSCYLSGVSLTNLRLAVLGVAAALLGGCAYKLPPYDYAREPDPRKDEFRLGPGDVLHVTVWHNTDLSGDATVRPDGTISLPLIGDVHAAGRTTAELRTEITQKLKTFIKDESATVSVAISTINSYRFVVSGNVEHPGVFIANHYVTVSEAMALTGGPNRFSSPVETVIIRTDAAGKTRRIPIDYPSILDGKHPEHDLALLPGDTIYVP
jgi:polysaccharide export outer membrane protein